MESDKAKRMTLGDSVCWLDDLPKGMCDSSADYPHDSLRRSEHELLFFEVSRCFLLNKEVADFLGSLR